MLDNGRFCCILMIYSRDSSILGQYTYGGGLRQQLTKRSEMIQLAELRVAMTSTCIHNRPILATGGLEYMPIFFY